MDQSPSLQDILAEVDPFLQATRKRWAAECVRYIVVSSFHDEKTCSLSLFRADLTLGSCWEDEECEFEYPWEPYSDKRLEAPPLYPNIYRNRSVPALARLADILLLAGVDANHKGIQGNTPILGIFESISDALGRETDVVDSGSAELDYLFRVFEVLIGAGTDVNGTDYNGQSLLHHACHLLPSRAPHLYSVRIFDMLLAAGARPNEPDSDGQTPLHAAGWYFSVWMVKRLLESGADASVEDQEGCTLLHTVVRHVYAVLHIKEPYGAR
ncbi:hypothetical protein BOTBODRAFT_301802 [Botryobasidium botryosum FD-172 SS1]|uniref:Uncharacterized protein n=1 Tax=Botryobasidium botryosum (strain FD-172 SS1) TaxID=930990 RepID=A0A067MH27_BOTB1|nr:hypothetical protein BOTBODRAFT_301802 [Botryobasidium botryosum FD-172 SS1]